MRVGFIGTGVMGSSMVRNLLKHHHEVNVYNRTKEKALALVEDGAIFKEDIKSCVEDVDAVITIVGYPKDVEEVYEEIFKYAKKGSLLIDMTTSKPSLAHALYLKGKVLGFSLLDAPVSGGDSGAKNGTLTIMVGGDHDAYLKAMPLFEAMGKTFNYIGGAGCGQHCKMANQICIAGTLAGDMEALVYMTKMNLDPQTVLNAISKGAAASSQMDHQIPRVLNDDYRPGFFLKHFIKDMQIALEESQRIDLVLPILEKVCAMYKELEEKGYGDLGTQALYKYYIH